MADIVSKLPPLAPYPPSPIRETLSASEWEACQDAWILNLQYRFKLQDADFKSAAFTAVGFLNSFFQAYTPASRISGKERTLRQVCFTYTRRLLRAIGSDKDSVDNFPGGLFSLLANFCTAYQTTSALKIAVKEAQDASSSSIIAAAENEKSRQIKLLSVKHSIVSESILTGFRLTSRAVQEFASIGAIFMTGDDYLDALCTEYAIAAQKNAEREQKVLVETLFVCLRSLTQIEPSRTSLLLDQLFSLKSICVDVPAARSRGSSQSPQRTILSALICSTSFLQYIKAFFADPAVLHHARAQAILTILQTYQQQTSYLHTPPRRRLRVAKGKDRAHGNINTNHEMHIHSMEQVSILQELFPDLPPSYFLRLLDYYNNNVEEVTAALLEPSSLPAHLAEPDAKSELAAEPVVPRLTIPERKNVFNDDEFAKLRVSSDQVHYGKAPKTDNQAISYEHESERAKHKAAILSALAAFDADDDERDDTYDVGDVGGTVDAALPGADDVEALAVKKEQQLAANRADEVLYKLWKEDPAAFARDTKSRLGQVRGQIKRDLSQATNQNWTDEMIEGWAVMLSRDAGRQRNLENRFGGAAAGYTRGQVQLERTSWRAGGDGEEDEGSDSSTRGRGRGRGGRGRGRGGGGGRGGSTAGSPSDSSTQAARRRKEQRGGGNHGRREGRAKKIARGFGGPSGS